jgi:hypothetical protein
MLACALPASQDRTNSDPGPPGVDQYIAAHTPAQFLQALVERRKSVLAFWIVRSPVVLP